MKKFCFNYYYNIHGNTNDGFDVLFDDYVELKFSLLKEIRGPLQIDKWVIDRIQLESEQFPSVFRVSYSFY